MFRPTPRTKNKASFPHILGPGPVAILGSRNLPAPALWRVWRLGAWVAASGFPVWSGCALGADSAGIAGALFASGQVRVFLPDAPIMAAMGSFGLPWSSPRGLLVRIPSFSVVPFAGGTSGTFITRLFARTRALLRALRLQAGSSVVLFISSTAFRSGTGGSFFTLRVALQLGFIPGQTLFVFSVSPSGLVQSVPASQFISIIKKEN